MGGASRVNGWRIETFGSEAPIVLRARERMRVRARGVRDIKCPLALSRCGPRARSARALVEGPPSQPILSEVSANWAIGALGVMQREAPTSSIPSGIRRAIKISASRSPRLFSLLLVRSNERDRDGASCCGEYWAPREGPRGPRKKEARNEIRRETH